VMECINKYGSEQDFVEPLDLRGTGGAHLS
jgi:hypothetical protein